LAACSSHYKTLYPVETDRNCLESIRPPEIETAWFDAGVDVTGRHISGLLLIKNMPDSSHRVVFTTEVGITFLDFEFRKDGSFELKKILPRLDKRPVINTLKTDFSLLLGLPFNHDMQSWKHDDRIYYGVKHKREMFYLVTDNGCSRVERFEIGSRRKRKVSIEFKGEVSRRPEEITIRHYSFDMVIHLKKIHSVNE
jgi:hypothetical protein